MKPASTAAFLIKNLCSSLQSAGTVITQRTLAGINLPTYSYNLDKAFAAINFKVS